MRKKLFALIAAVIVLGIIAGCSKTNGGDEKTEITMGYFPNMSHAPAMVAIEEGILVKNLKDDIEVNTMTFPNGSLFMDALSTGQIDFGYVGPGPVLNRYLQGGEVVLIQGAANGENVLVVRSDLEYNSVKDLEGKIVATASTGCTHDLILRKMLALEGLAVEENGGTVKRIAQKPATTIGLFQQKQIDATLVSEPWATILEEEGIARTVVDAKEVHWDGNLPATVLVASKSFYENNPKIIEQILKSNEEAIDFINENNERAAQIIVNQIKDITNEEIREDIILKAMDRVFYTSELDREIVQEFADFSKSLGFVEGSSDLSGLYPSD